MIDKNIKLPECWKSKLKNEFAAQYMQDIRTFLASELEKGKVIYPPINKIFEALNLTLFAEVKIIIVGQDPYHGIGQAHGLSFSVNTNQVLPPSLKNIYQELRNNYPNITLSHGNLSAWARQGVLLLNSSLTVEANKPNSHQQIGWEFFTNSIISHCSESGSKVFMLWGRNARNKSSLIDKTKNLVLEAVHPSPLSAHNGFFGCKHFLRANHYLSQIGCQEVNWSIK
ncbi:MAG: uracil-DNA glycosylase [Gammaproteobacteria bacterium]